MLKPTLLIAFLSFSFSLQALELTCAEATVADELVLTETTHIFCDGDAHGGMGGEIVIQAGSCPNFHLWVCNLESEFFYLNVAGEEPQLYTPAEQGGAYESASGSCRWMLLGS